MKRTLGVAMVLLVGCATGASVRDLVVPARAQGQVGPTYEYDVAQVANGKENDREALRKYSREGWRRVAATQDGPWRTLYLERQLAAR